MGDIIKFLVIEDNEGDRLLLDLALEKHKVLNHADHAETLGDALKMIEDNYYHIIITDLSLPDSQGIETFKAVKSAVSSGEHVVCLSGAGDDHTVRDARKAGAEYFVEKPMSPKDLEQIITDIKSAKRQYVFDRLPEINHKPEKKTNKRSAIAAIMLFISSILTTSANSYAVDIYELSPQQLTELVVK